MKRALCTLAAVVVVWIRQAPVWAIPIVGAPIAMDAPVVAPAAGAQALPAIAFDGTNYLVVWLDSRDLGNTALYGARVDKTGKVLDPAGFRIQDDAGLAGIAYGGGEFLVAWWTGGNAIAYARLDGSGKMLDPAPALLTTTAGGLSAPSIAWNGSEFLVVWEDWRAKQADVYGARVSKAGAILDPAGIAISTSQGGHRSPAVASDGNRFFVTWMDDRVNASLPRVFAARVASNGSVLDPQALYVSPGDHEQFYPKVCFDGGNYQLAWEDVEVSTLKGGMHGALVSPAGVTVVSDLVLSSTSTKSALAAACGTGGSLMVWAGGSTRVDTAGRVLDPAGLSIPPETSYGINPAVASDGTNYLMVFGDPSGRPFLVSTTVSATGSVAVPAGLKMFKASNTESHPAIVRGANGYLALMLDDRGGAGNDLYSLTLDNTGAPSSAPLLIAARAYVSQLGLAWNGSHYLVAWQAGPNASGMQIVRLDGLGKPLGLVTLPNGSGIGGGNASSVGLASDGNQFLLAWTDYRNTPPKPTPATFSIPDPDIYATRIGDDGTVLDPQGIQVAGGTAQQTSPALGFDGTNFLAVWNEGGSLRATRLDRSGAILDASALQVGSAGVSIPSIVWGKGTYLIAWLDSAGPVWRRMDGTAKFLDAAPMQVPALSSAVNPRGLATAWDGQAFLIAWFGGYGRNGFALGARVGADGSAPDSTGFAIEPPIAGEPLGQSALPSQIGLASDGSGHWVSIADRYDSSPGVEVVRVRSRLITDCSGGQCPSPPDGGLFPPVDAGGADAGLLDAKAADGGGGADVADAGVVRSDTAVSPDLRAVDDAANTRTDAGVTGDAAVAKGDTGAMGDAVIAPVDGHVAVSDGDAGGRDAGGDVTKTTKASAKGCSCSVGGRSDGSFNGTSSASPWAILVLAFGFLLWKPRRRG